MTATMDETKDATDISALETVDPGQMTHDQQLAWLRQPRGRRCGVQCTEDDTARASAGETGAGWNCTRLLHPPGTQHIAGNSEPANYAYVVWDSEVEDVTDGVDTAPTPELEVGKIYKFRNRQTKLVYLGTRKTGKIEVLDLTHQRYRVLDREQLIARPPDAEPTTPEELQWIATFMAQRREETRRNALQQRRDGYFKSADQLNGILNELGLRPFGTVRRGDVNMTFSVESQMSNSDVQAALATWVRNTPLPKGIKLVGAGLNILAALRVHEEE